MHIYESPGTRQHARSHPYNKIAAAKVGVGGGGGGGAKEEGGRGREKRRRRKKKKNRCVFAQTAARFPPGRGLKKQPAFHARCAAMQEVRTFPNRWRYRLQETQRSHRGTKKQPRLTSVKCFACFFDPLLVCSRCSYGCSLIADIPE